MLICKDCGTQAIEGNIFCNNCGSVLKTQPIITPVVIPSVYTTSLNIGIIDFSKFVLIYGGSFKIGSLESESKRNDDEGPAHSVRVNSFYISKYLVTQKEYKDVMGKNPSNFPGDNNPVEMVCWYDTIEYCNRLSIKEGFSPAYNLFGSTNPDDWDVQGPKWDSITINLDSKGYRLPTEAQWEYACRAGTTTPFYTGDKISSLQANFNGTSPYGNSAAGDYLKKTTPVGSYPANPWGLFDMHGNVWEWCWDWKENYTSDNKIDPTGPVSGKYRAERGGSWSSGGNNIRSAIRSYDFPSIKGYNDGFRLVLPKS